MLQNAFQGGVYPPPSVVNPFIFSFFGLQRLKHVETNGFPIQRLGLTRSILASDGMRGSPCASHILGAWPVNGLMTFLSCWSTWLPPTPTEWQKKVTTSLKVPMCR